MQTLQGARESLKHLPHQIVQTGLRAGATDVIGQVQLDRTRMVRFSNNSITVVKTWNVVNPLVYLGFGKRNISSRISDTSLDIIDSTIARMVTAARALPESTVESHLPKGPFSYQNIPGTYDSKIPYLERELIDYVDSAINAASAEGAKRVSGVLSTYDSKKMLVTSNGAEASAGATMIEMSLRSFVGDDSSGQGISVSTTLNDFDPGAAGSDSGSLAKMAENPEEGKEGKYNVVFGPSIYADFLQRVASSTSAYAVDAGFSFFTEKLGQNVASEILTVTDDRVRSNGPGTAPFDDEGYPSQSNRLIEKGVLRTYVHDSRTAAKHNSPLTGNATWIADVGQIIPIPTSLVVEPGDQTREELFDEAGDGLYITNNWYTRFQNYRTGEFSTIPRDAMFLIKNGKLAGPVKGLRVSDNMLRILQATRAISRERKWIRWWEVSLPTYLGHFLVDQVGLTKSTS